MFFTYILKKSDEKAQKKGKKPKFPLENTFLKMLNPPR